MHVEAAGHMPPRLLKEKFEKLTVDLRRKSFEPVDEKMRQTCDKNFLNRIVSSTQQILIFLKGLKLQVDCA